ncbi:hypothetical protein G9A89_014135 [Geosiphon pyriformis]|nr:hypothetical protein G9A89_014135 [Geosiphon pyriformis]
MSTPKNLASRSKVNTFTPENLFAIQGLILETTRLVFRPPIFAVKTREPLGEIFWELAVTTQGLEKMNDGVSTAMSNIGLCLGVGKTIKLADKTASNLFSLQEMLAIWSNIFSSERSRTLTHKAKIITADIKPLTNSMPKLISINSAKDKLLGEPLTTEAQVASLKETGQDMTHLGKDKPAQTKLTPLNTSIKQMAASLALLELKHITAQWTCM